MDTENTVKALSALAQASRLNAFRLLVTQGETGLAAGEIARHLDIPHNTLSSHLAILSNAGLVRSERQSRSIIYRVDFEGMRDLLAFLLEDCCQGQADLCEPALDSLLANCCPTTEIAQETAENTRRQS